MDSYDRRPSPLGLPAQLHTKKGAKAMITKNLDCSVGLVRGTICAIDETIPADRPGPPLSVTVLLMMPDYDGPCVRRTEPFQGYPRGAPAVSIAPWTAPAGQVGTKTRIRSQIPLRIAYAMTTYRAQGATLERVGMTQTSGEVMSDPALQAAVLSRTPNPSNIAYMGADYKSAGADSHADKCNSHH